MKLDWSDLDLGASRYWFCVGASPFGFALIGWFYLIFIFLGFFCTLPVRFLVKNADVLYVALAVPACAALFGIAALVTAGPAAARERRWVASLPFAVHGFFGLFNGRHSADYRDRFMVQIRFADGVTAGDSAALSALIGADTIAKIVSATESTVALRCTVPGGSTTSDWASFRRLFASVHALADTVLLPLHQRWPIARVELRDR